MIGEKNGVYGNFKNDIPNLISIHCLAHRINLVSSDIIEKFPLLKLIDTTLYNGHKLFKRSPQKLQILEALELQELKKIYKVLKPTKIRWFSLYNALIRLLFLWNPMVEALKELENEDVNALGLYSCLTTYKFLFMAHYLTDFMGTLNILNLVFQDKKY